MRKLLSPSLLAAFILTVVTGVTATAAPVIHTSGPDLGVYSVGEVETALTATGGDGSNYEWTLAPGSLPLPPGLAIRTDTPGWFPSNARAGIIGVATLAGEYHFTLRATSGGEFADRDYTLIVSSLVVKDQWQVFDAFVGVPYAYLVLGVAAMVVVDLWVRARLSRPRG